MKGLSEAKIKELAKKLKGSNAWDRAMSILQEAAFDQVAEANQGVDYSDDDVHDRLMDESGQVITEAFKLHLWT